MNAPSSLAVDPSHDELFVLNASSVTVYNRAATGNTAPLRTLTGAATGLNAPPQSLAVDLTHDELFVLIDNDNSTSIAVYPRTAAGNTAPLRTLTNNTVFLPAGLALDLTHNELFAGYGTNLSELPAVAVYSRTASGNTAPLRAISGVATGLSDPRDVAVDLTHDELFVANASSVTVHGRTASGNAAPIRTLSGPSTGLSSPAGLALAEAFNYTLTNSPSPSQPPGALAISINATLTAGSTQPVSFAVSGIPSGVTAGLSPTACSPTCATTLTITRTGCPTPDTYPITVTGSPLNRTTSFGLLVQPDTFDYTLSNSGGITVIPGGSGATTITATLQSCSPQPVSFQVSGLPSGATPVFTPGSCNPTCSPTLTITTTASTPAGTFPITVTGTPLNRTTSFNLVVNPIPFDYTLTNAGGVTVTAGASVGTTITATLQAGTPQTVSFAASGLPSGATAAFSPTTCSPTCSPTLTVATTPLTPPGTYPITVTGSPLGRTTIFNLVVNSPPFDYNLTNTGSVPVTPGASGTTTITATLQAATTQPVSFAASGLPSGATAAFSPTPCSPTCSTTLTIATSASTPIGTFLITVTGSPLGRITTLNLIVSVQPFNYTLTNADVVTATAGASGTTAITATLTAGATQVVSYAASGLPSGATAAFSPTSCSPTCSTTLTIATTASTPVGTYPITATGSPLGKTTAFNLIVTASPFDYTLTNAGGVTAPAGASGTTIITATLTAGATQAVSFTASGLPSGATAAFSPTPCSPTCSTTLTIATTASAPTGTFVITVTGNPLGRTTALNLIVNAANAAAIVTSVSGDVQVQFLGSVLTVTPGFALMQNMRLRTGADGRVGGGCDDGSSFSLEPNSNVFLNDSLCHPADSGFLDVTRGAFRLARSAAAADGRPAAVGEVNSVVRTPVSDAKGATGAGYFTTYTQAANTGIATTTVSSGSVDVTDASTGNVAVARPGQPVNTTGPVPRLAASILPSSRSVTVGTTATAFATIVNAAGSPRALACDMTPLTGVPAAFEFQITNPATNQLVGSKGTPVGIAPGAFQTYVFGLTPTGPIGSTDVQISFACGDSAATSIVGVNTLLLTAAATPVPDIVALAATLNNDGIVNIPGATGTGVFAVAAVNLGVGGPITVSADTGNALLPVAISLCQTNPTTSACLAPPAASVTTTIAAGETPTFGVFVTGTGSVPFDPGQNRIFVRFRDPAPGNVTRGSTSVAVRTQ